MSHLFGISFNKTSGTFSRKRIIFECSFYERLHENGKYLMHHFSQAFIYSWRMHGMKSISCSQSEYEMAINRTKSCDLNEFFFFSSKCSKIFTSRMTKKLQHLQITITKTKCCCSYTIYRFHIKTHSFELHFDWTIRNNGFHFYFSHIV